MGQLRIDLAEKPRVSPTGWYLHTRVARIGSLEFDYFVKVYFRDEETDDDYGRAVELRLFGYSSSNNAVTLATSTGALATLNPITGSVNYFDQDADPEAEGSIEGIRFDFTPTEIYLTSWEGRMTIYDQREAALADSISSTQTFPDGDVNLSQIQVTRVELVNNYTNAETGGVTGFPFKVDYIDIRER